MHRPEDEDSESPRHYLFATTNTHQAPAPLRDRKQNSHLYQDGESPGASVRRVEFWAKLGHGHGHPISNSLSIPTLFPKQVTTCICLDHFSVLSHSVILGLGKDFFTPSVKDYIHVSCCWYVYLHQTLWPASCRNTQKPVFLNLFILLSSPLTHKRLFYSFFFNHPPTEILILQIAYISVYILYTCLYTTCTAMINA